MPRALICLLVAACLGSPPPAPAQQPSSAAQDRPEQRAEQSQPPRDTPATISLRSLPKNVLLDQKAFWTMPTRFRARDSQWLLPAALVTAFAIGSDTALERRMPASPSQLRRSQRIADAGLLALAGTAGGMFLWGRVKRNDRLAETGLLAGEALADTLAVTMTMNAMAGRQRPGEGGGRGRFAEGGDSFPSEHAALSWTLASVIAHRYPGRLTQILAYGTAAGVSAARLSGRKHFASDVLVGSALGWYMGRQVVRARGSDRDPDTANWGRFVRGEDGAGGGTSIASPYVPLDSWVYAAFDRLSALGYAPTAFAGLRPWTRRECARLLDEAAEAMAVEAGDRSADEARETYAALRREFASELSGGEGAPAPEAQIETIYARVGGISGTPLTDGYNFGQTIINDFGRPYGEGFQAVSGITARAAAGPFAAYVRVEFQHASPAPLLPDAARAAIAAADSLPVPPAVAHGEINRGRLLEAYVALNLSGWQLSFGRQALWWGPGQGGPMLLSNNAEPMNMLRFGRVSPIKLPGIFGRLGPVRTEFFLAQLSGHEFLVTPEGFIGEYGHALNPQPYLHGQKISFAPTPNFQFGVFRTTVYGGPGYPLTLHTLGRSLFSTGNELAGSPDKPGDRRSGFDFSYRVPKLRDWLTFYGDGFADDEFSPIAYPDRSAWRAGLYLPRLPRLPKLDLRAEGVYTDNPIGGAVGRGYYYTNGTWRSGYRNAGNLVGSWIGRDGQGAQAWATWHFTPRSFVQVAWRHQKVSAQFLSGGGTLSDLGVRSDFWVRSRMSVSTAVQYERWTFPVLAPRPQSNLSASLQLTFWPKLTFRAGGRERGSLPAAGSGAGN
jgi:membrane-associated phospholipid phosphatase